MITIFHKGKTISTSVGSIAYEAESMGLRSSINNREHYVPAGYANRPDLISSLFFNGPSDWWIVMEKNGLSDPFESLKVGDKIIL